MIDHVKRILLGQYEAALRMMHDCIEACPPEHWDGKIARYPFWQVAYHALCFTDLYLSPSETTFQPRPEIHPNGWSEFNDEYPSRRFDKREMLDYIAFCREKAIASLAVETRETLEGPTGFARRAFSRGELHIYSIRHIQHHVGQLGVYLRRIDESFQDPKTLRWAGTGWTRA